MTEIKIYDTDAGLINKVADKNDMTVADVIEALCEYMDDMIKDSYLEKPE